MVKSALTRKLIRDMWRNRMQFVAMILLCALGTWCFAGLDAAWRMLDTSVDYYFEQQDMADFWVHMTPMDKEAVTKLQSIDGIADVQARASLDMDVDLPHEPSVAVNAFDGDIRMNLPLIVEGEALTGSNLRGCLLEQQFAEANHLQVGDKMTVELGDTKTDFTIMGICLSPEHIITTKDIRPDPQSYGFMLVNSAALPYVTLNEAVIKLEDGADAAAVQQAVEAMYPQALTVGRDQHASTQSTTSDIDMFRNLSYLFPVLAFAVAALIVLTTLTRMIENQRIQMGTLKALGYRNGAITRHYLSYALYPSIVGALLGLFTGRISLPYILWNFEATFYILPWQIQAPISLGQWGICILCVALCLFICLHTYRKESRETMAALLRPKPPKAGKKLFLERIPGLWERLSFNGKMTFRNLMRNKLRTLMSLVGILCCTMLMITSLGLQDSISYFVDRYYQGTLGYTVRAELAGDAGKSEAYQSRVEAERVEPLMERSITIFSDSVSRTSLLSVVEDEQTLLNLGENETYMPLPASGVALTQKLAEVLNVQQGDTVRILLAGDDEAILLPVAAICQVNIGQGVYMARTQWKDCRKDDFTPTALLVLNPTDAGIQKLLDMDEVDELRYPVEQALKMNSMLNSLMTVFMLMSALALGLCFVVLYNMGILNFVERYREYATLKVLGYHQREIRHLMFSENAIIMGLGVVGGIIPGIWLTSMVLRLCETDSMRFVSYVSPLSILISCMITALFSMFVTWILTRKVPTIDMVEALKSVE